MYVEDGNPVSIFKDVIITDADYPKILFMEEATVGENGKLISSSVENFRFGLLIARWAVKLVLTSSSLGLMLGTLVT